MRVTPVVLLLLLACDPRPEESGEPPDDSVPQDTGPVDADGDGYFAHEDCDDEDPAIFPGAEEVCDGEDNDCDGGVDEGLSSAPYYMDSDGDGFGSGEPYGEDCGAPDGYSMEDGDCDDHDATVHPGAEESPCDQVDSDCDGIGSDAYQAAVEGVEYEELQAAIDAVPFGGTVYVCPGLHEVSLEVPDAQRLELASWSGSAEDTILSGGGAARILTVGDYAEIAIRNLGFQDGRAIHGEDSYSGYGGAILAFNADFVLHGCTFSACEASGDGGAALVVWTDDPNPAHYLVVEDCVFEGNRTHYNTGGALGVICTSESVCEASVSRTTFTGNESPESGGAAYFLDSEHSDLAVTIEDCVFEGNSTRLGNDGGALVLGGSPGDTFTITGTSFIDNLAGSDGGAIEIYPRADASEGDPPVTLILQDTVFEGNSAYDSGGAIAIRGVASTDPTLALDIRDSSFVGNSAASGGVFGIQANHAVVSAVRSSFEDNSAGQGEGLFVAAGYSVDVDLEFDQCLLSGNTAPDTALGLLLLEGEATLRFTDSEIRDNVGGGAGAAVNVSTYEPIDISFVRTVIDGNEGGGDASFLDLSDPVGIVTLSFEDSAVTSNVSPTHAAAVATNKLAFITSVATDWGTDSTDNETCDLMMWDISAPMEGLELCELGTNETFTCPGDGECYW